MPKFYFGISVQTAYSDLPNNHAANFIPIIGIKFAEFIVAEIKTIKLSYLKAPIIYFEIERCLI